MILDRLENAAMYRTLGPRIALAFDYLCQTDFSGVADGRHELDGDRVYAIVLRYRPKPIAEATWEAHRYYIDVQYVVEGVERMGYTPLRDELAIRQAYDPQKDFALYEAGGAFFDVHAGSFALFAPHDVHAPSLAAESARVPGDVHKVVVKCRV